MSDPTQGGRPAPADPHGPTGPHPPDWSSSDSVLEAEIRAEERRIAADERRIAADEREIRVNRLLGLGALVLIALTVTALVVSIIALNRDIESVAKATPKDNSVSTGTIKNGAVTGSKLADGAVTGSKLAKGVVTAAAVADDSLTGAQINEASLAQVRKAAQAGIAANATQLGGAAAGAYLQGVKVVQTATDRTPAALKGPTVASCPSGTRMIGGGAEVQGARNVAIIESAPSGTTAWTAIAARQTGSAPSWNLVVFAICAAGGS